MFKMELPLCTILTIIFVVSRITGYIDWSWLWVFSPLWLPVLTVFGIMFCIALILGACKMHGEYKKAKRQTGRAKRSAF